MVAEPVEKLRFLSPGEVEQIASPGMGAGMNGFASVRGSLEMSGEDFILVVSNAGTRQQVTFRLGGKNAQGLPQAHRPDGPGDRGGGQGVRLGRNASRSRASSRGRPRCADSRDNLEVGRASRARTRPSGRREAQPGAGRAPPRARRLPLGDRAHDVQADRTPRGELQPCTPGPRTREFFFTPRNPGPTTWTSSWPRCTRPAQVLRTYKLVVNVRQ